MDPALPFGPDGQLFDPTAGFQFEDLFSCLTQPALHNPPPEEPSSSRPPAVPIHIHESSSETSSPPPLEPAAGTSNLRKRGRSNIALAPDQPPTARGNDRIRVYVACHECRARKIRCDGAKPVCIQCQKRPSGSGACTYNAATKRKGRPKRSEGNARGTQKANSKKRLRPAASAAGSPLRSDGVDEVCPSTDEPPSTSSYPPSSAASGSEAIELESTHSVDGYNEPIDYELDDVQQYDPFAFDPNHPELFLLSHVPAGGASDNRTQGEEEEESIPARPSPRFTRETWWDALVAFYVSEGGMSADMQAITPTAEQRNGALRHMVSDLRALFHASASMMSFLHLPRFFAKLLDPDQRMEMQPSLLMSTLALGTLVQSSDLEKGEPGRQRALKLLDMAYAALQSSLATGWVDIGLVQAGWMIVYFEFSSHPLLAWERSHSALVLLDSLIRLFSLTTIDANSHLINKANPFSLPGYAQRFGGRFISGTNMHGHATGGYAGRLGVGPSLPSGIPHSFSYGTAGHSAPQPNIYVAANQPTEVPFQEASPATRNPYTFTNPSHTANSDGSSIPPHGHPARGERGCSCAPWALKHAWPSIQEFAPVWGTTIMWPTGLSEAEFRKEECRRLVWSSVGIVADLNLYAGISPAGVQETGQIFVRETESFLVQTPSETLASTGTPVETDDIWTLNLRANLLLHSCLRARRSTTMSGAERAEFAVRTWFEIDDLERRLKRHTCGLWTKYGFQSSDLIFSLRLNVSYDFQRFIPQITTTGSTLFYRDKAESWLRQLAAIDKSIWEGLLASEAGSEERCHRRSLLIFWYISGIRKCLVLWGADRTLRVALTIACELSAHLEHVLLNWPSPRLRMFWQIVRYKLVNACITAGLPPPSATIPRPISREDTLAPAASS